MYDSLGVLATSRKVPCPTTFVTIWPLKSHRTPTVLLIELPVKSPVTVDSTLNNDALLLPDSYIITMTSDDTLRTPTVEPWNLLGADYLNGPYKLFGMLPTAAVKPLSLLYVGPWRILDEDRKLFEQAKPSDPPVQCLLC